MSFQNAPMHLLHDGAGIAPARNAYASISAIEEKDDS